MPGAEGTGPSPSLLCGGLASPGLGFGLVQEHVPVIGLAGGIVDSSLRMLIKLTGLLRLLGLSNSTMSFLSCTTYITRIMTTIIRIVTSAKFRQIKLSTVSIVMD